MNGKSLKAQYRDCYRLERLIQQAIATFDYTSEKELSEEFETYRFPARKAAVNNWLDKIDARIPGGLVYYPNLLKWRAEFARKMHYQ